MADSRKIAEIAGLAAVVLSLLFLGYELKRANDIAEGEAVSSMMSEANEFMSLIAGDETLFRIWSQGSTDFELLSSDEKARFASLAGIVLNLYEMSFTYIENGLVDDWFIRSFTKDFCTLVVSNDGFAKIWEANKGSRADGLVAFADVHCQADPD